MRALSLTDHLFLLLEHQQPMHIAVVCLFRLPRAQSLDNFIPPLLDTIYRSSAAPTYPFNQVLYRKVYWRSVSRIDIDKHFFYHTLQENAGNAELLAHLSNLHSQPLVLTRPMWQLHLIDGLAPSDGQARFAIYLKIHHALVDGIGGMRVLRAALSEDPQALLTAPFWALIKPQKAHNPPPKSTAIKPLSSISNITKALHKRWQERHLISFTSSFAAPPSALNTAIDGSRRLAIRSYNKARFTRIAQAFAVSGNDVVLAVCAGALARYLATHYQLPTRPLVGFVPISLRDDDGLAGNRLSFLLSNLATDVADRQARLLAISQSMQDSKARIAGLNYNEIIGYSLAIYAATGANLLTGLLPTRQGFNLIISNTPGNAKPLYLNGAILEGVYPASVLLQGQALNITLVNYAGNLDFAITACDSVLHDSDSLLDLIADELDSYEQLASAQAN